MDRLGFLLLSILSRNSALDEASAMTTKEILDTENMGCKYNTIYKKASAFQAAGYLATGYSEGRARTFYITGKGKELVKNQGRGDLL